MLLSIITPCLNRVSFVREAVESVLKQDYSPVEHIVVDGGSTDGTLDVLDEFKDIRVISEPDNGVYDAINKGILAARGEVIGFLNADDMYVLEVFPYIVKRFQENRELKALCGGAEILDRAGSQDVVRQVFLSPFYSSLSVRNICLGQPILNARFFRKDIFEKVGLFDWRYRIASDRDFLIRMALARVTSEYLPKCVYRYRYHQGSLTFNPSGTHAREANDEYWSIAENFLQSRISLRERLWLQVWHARISTEMVLMTLRKRELNLMLSTLRRGFKVSPWWPAFLGMRLAKSLKTILRNATA